MLDRQLHPAVHEGVVLPGSIDPLACVVGGKVNNGGPCAFFAKANHLGGRPVHPCSIARDNLVAVHCLFSVGVRDDARGRLKELVANHPAKSTLVKANLA